MCKCDQSWKDNWNSVKLGKLDPILPLPQTYSMNNKKEKEKLGKQIEWSTSIPLQTWSQRKNEYNKSTHAPLERIKPIKRAVPINIVDIMSTLVVMKWRRGGGGKGNGSSIDRQLFDSYLHIAGGGKG